MLVWVSLKDKIDFSSSSNGKGTQLFLAELLFLLPFIFSPQNEGEKKKLKSFETPWHISNVCWNLVLVGSLSYLLCFIYWCIHIQAKRSLSQAVGCFSPSLLEVAREVSRADINDFLCMSAQDRTASRTPELIWSACVTLSKMDHRVAVINNECN